MLLRGSELAQAESVIGVDADPRATPDQTRFVVASRQAATRRQRSVVAIATCVALVAATMGVFAWTQRSAAIANEREANAQRATAERQRDRAEEQTAIARSQALAAASTASLAQETARGALLAIEAYATAPTPEALDALHRAAQQTEHLERTMRPHEGGVYAVDFSPDGRLLASAGNDGTVTIADAATGELVVPPIPIGSPTWGVAFDPSGSILASGSDDRRIRLWDPATGEPLGPPLEGHRGAVNFLAFTRDGKTLASGSGDQTVILWDVATRSLRTILHDRNGASLRGGLQSGWRAAGNRGAIV